jgi:pyruvate dehydrogenase E2 component (dihydrolipoamide acetyltransferase)
MMIEALIMPRLGETMDSGRIARWLKKPGDSFVRGETIVEIETDKTLVEYPALASGKLVEVLVEDGGEAAVGTPIARIEIEGRDAAIQVKDEEPPALVQAAEIPSGRLGVTSAPPTLGATPQEAARAEVPGAGLNIAPAPPKLGSRQPLRATPAARRLARQHNVSLASVMGTGRRQRIGRNDILAVINRPHPSAGLLETFAPPIGELAAPALSAVTQGVGVVGAYRDIPISNMRRLIARRLTEAKQNVPHFYLTIDAQIDKLLALRAELNAKEAAPISVNDMIIKASALSLRKVPAVNASFTESAIRQYLDVDVAVAVATAEGLITPVIRNADRKMLATIALEMKELIGRARRGKLMPEEYRGGGFTVSNLGMFGVREFAAIIDPPRACILGIGAGEPRPVVKDGRLAIATVMSCTLSADHRVVDGVLGAEFLSALKAMIEDPSLLVGGCDEIRCGLLDSTGSEDNVP